MLRRMEEIRNLVTLYNKKFSISKDRSLWNRLCSSLDVVEDTDLATKSYLKSKNPKDEGLKYLRLYGLLQTLYVQQFALNGICESLGLSCILSDPILKKVRDDRNDSTGHPTNRRTGVYHYIVRDSITKRGYEVISFDKNNRFSHRYISIKYLITQQKKKVLLILKGIKGELDTSISSKKNKQ